MFAILIAGALNTVVLSSFILLTYFKGYEYFLNNTIKFTQNDVYSSIYFSIAVTSLLVLIFSTKVSDFFFNLVRHNRRPIEREKECLEPLLEEVHNAAVKKFNLKKLKIKLKIKDDKRHNMSAVGLSTVVINRKMYEDYDDETLKALMAHELAHLFHRDSVNLGIIYILIGLCSLFIMACSTIMIFCAIMAKTLSRGITILLLPAILVVVCCVALAFLILVSTFYCFNLFLRFYYRRNEYRADKFASDLRYGEELIRFFEMTKDADYELKGIKKHLFATHPKTILRIGRLEKILWETR